MKNYYNILGLHESASTQNVIDAYKKLALKFHPDKNGDDPFFANWFKSINEARQVLADNEKRAEYDYTLDLYHASYETVKQQQLQKSYYAEQEKVLAERSNRSNRGWWIAGIILLILASAFVFLYPEDVDYKAHQKTIISEQPNEQQPVVEDVTAVAAKPETQELLPANEPVTDKVQTSTSSQKAALQNASIKEKKSAFVEVKKPDTEIKRSLSVAERDDILMKLRASVKNKCVQVIQTDNSNIAPDFAIATWLQTEGFIIGGRKIMHDDRQGISIEEGDDCNRLIIGSIK